MSRNCSLAASKAATECVMFSRVLFLMLHFLWTFAFSMFCTHCLMCSFPEEHIQHVEQCNLTEVTVTVVVRQIHPAA